MVVQAGQILSAARLNGLVSGFQADLDTKVAGFIKVKPVDTSRASTTTFSDDPHLTAQVAANTNYGFFINAGVAIPATPQMKIQYIFPSGTIDSASWDYDPGADEWAINASGTISQTSPATAVGGLASAGTNIPLRLSGGLRIGGTGGTFAVQWAQVVSNASATIMRAGSYMYLFPTN